MDMMGKLPLKYINMKCTCESSPKSDAWKLWRCFSLFFQDSVIDWAVTFTFIFKGSLKFGFCLQLFFIFRYVYWLFILHIFLLSALSVFLGGFWRYINVFIIIIIMLGHMQVVILVTEYEGKKLLTTHLTLCSIFQFSWH